MKKHKLTKQDWKAIKEGVRLTMKHDKIWVLCAYLWVLSPFVLLLFAVVKEGIELDLKARLIYAITALIIPAIITYGIFYYTQYKYHIRAFYEHREGDDRILW